MSQSVCKKDGPALSENFFLIVLFLLLAGFSFYHVDRSILVVKYLFQYNIQILPQNYFRYHHFFKDFIFQTSIFHQGNSEAGWKTIFFLWPLFLFCDALGGLTLTHICLFTVTTSLLTIILFYRWVRKYWGNGPAFWGAFFLGFSAIFQEFARSGSYDAYSIMVAMLWIMLFFHCARKTTVISYGLLGFFTGLSWYGYSMLRTLIIPVFIEIDYFAKRKWASSALFTAGILLWIVPGIIILLNQLRSYHYHGPLMIFLLDKENMLSVAHGRLLYLFSALFHNLWNFIIRMFGFNDQLDYPSRNQVHAHYLNHLLVIPLALGIKRVFSLRKEFPNRLLLSLSAVIYLTPLFTSDFANVEGRRFLFYVLPTYCFIGLGMQQLFGFKSLPKLLIPAGIAFVLIFELLFTCRFILDDQRDLGLMDFANKLNERQENATIVYLEKRQLSLYKFSNEGYLLRLLLEKNGRHSYQVEEILLDAPPKPLPEEFYLAKSPVITRQEFQDWCQSNKLKCGVPVMESAIKNQSNVVADKSLGIIQPFKLYDIKQIP